MKTKTWGRSKHSSIDSTVMGGYKAAFTNENGTLLSAA
mgnify:CR=1 FL=1